MISRSTVKRLPTSVRVRSSRAAPELHAVKDDAVLHLRLFGDDQVVVLLAALYEQVFPGNEISSDVTGRIGSLTFSRFIETPPPWISLRHSPFEGRSASSRLQSSTKGIASSVRAMRNCGTPSKTCSRVCSRRRSARKWRLRRIRIEASTAFSYHASGS